MSSRLRRVLKNYDTAGNTGEPVYLDNDAQSRLIAELKSTQPFGMGGELTDSGKIIIKASKAAQLLFVLLNLLLVTVPVYRKGVNAIYSSASCLSMLTSALMIQIHFLNRSSEQSLASKMVNERLMPVLVSHGVDDRKLTKFNYVLSTFILVSKARTLFSEFVPSECVYLLPFMFVYGIHSTANDIEIIDKGIKSLERARYDYKEA
ncbi:unnamed protein product [Kuraishia capsulata CBS 1993]|uniref:Uncharacterized protein n=1 Tax=Kuraishia capsulata CBS 1993 TaxID=1382522 RepID=W6MRT7_9ASCO|nr:uncharacterized protein KUCA_T00003937001 [Kuraishia capsulata CBS 1993]CDK27957.1 unnamed protein product [Kuraishia capsulata CBS 1993]